MVALCRALDLGRDRGDVCSRVYVYVVDNSVSETRYFVDDSGKGAHLVHVHVGEREPKCSIVCRARST